MKLSQISSYLLTHQWHSLPIADLLEGKLHTIGDIPVSISNSNYYGKSNILKNIVHKAAIKHDILDDKEAQNVSDLLASTEQQLDKFCQQDQTRKVHLLRKDNWGKLLWYQPQGSLETLLEYIIVPPGWAFWLKLGSTHTGSIVSMISEVRASVGLTFPLSNSCYLPDNSQLSLNAPTVCTNAVSVFVIAQ